MNKIYDVAVVGAGIAGTATALSLGKAGINVCLLDASNSLRSATEGATNPDSQTLDHREIKRECVDDFSPRVSAITPANADWLSSIGAWQLLDEQQLLGYTRMHVWEELGSGEINFEAGDYQRPSLGFIVENDSLLRALMSAIADAPNIECCFDRSIQKCRLNDERVHVIECVEETIQARLLVGADGANSFVRRVLNIPTREWDYDQSAIVCTAETAHHHAMTAWQRFAEQGPVAYLPLADTLSHSDPSHGHFSSIVWSLDSVEAERVSALDDDAFMRELAKALDTKLGELQSVSARFKVPLRQRHAKRYTAKQAVLIGDAAHTIHPLAGQGLNLGLGDVKALVEVLVEASQKSYDLAHPVLLERYQRARKVENLSMMLSMEGFKRLFGSSDPILRWLRNTGVNAVDRHTLIKRQIATRAMGL